MNKKIARATLVAALCVAAGAHAQVGDSSGYVVDGRGAIFKNGFGQCWRAGYWTPAMAVAECDAALVKKEAPVANPPAAAPPAPAAAPEAARPAPAPARAPAAAARGPVTVVLKGSLFDFNKAVLRPAAKAQLDEQVVAKVKSMGRVKQLIVAGHSDRLGKPASNQKLSERRADAVKTYLVGKGVDAKLIETMGYGATQPAQGVPKCADKLPRKDLIACLEPHRRVEIEIQPAP